MYAEHEIILASLLTMINDTFE